MKTHAKTSIFLVFFLFSLFINHYSFLSAQAPQGFNYQAIVRDAQGAVVASQQVGFQFSIIQNNIYGASIYVETHSMSTNEFGLVILFIGEGTVKHGIFTSIDWSADSYFLKVEMDASGGANYTEMGIAQMLSVPYALHSKTAENIFSGNYNDLSNTPLNVSYFSNDAGYLSLESDPIFNISVAQGISSGDTSNWNETHLWGNHAIESYLKTEVDGSISNEIQDLSLSNNTLMITNNASATEIILDKYLDNTDSWVKSDENIYFVGKVGIGISDFSERLNLYGNLQISANDYGINFYDVNTRIWKNNDDLFLTADDDIIFRPDDDIYINTGDNTISWVRFDNGAQRLGIGELYPSDPLHVRSGIDHHAINIEENNGEEDWQIGVDASGDLCFYNSGSSSPAMEITDNNNVGFGYPSSTFKLYAWRNANCYTGLSTESIGVYSTITTHSSSTAYGARFFSYNNLGTNYGVDCNASGDKGSIYGGFFTASMTGTTSSPGTAYGVRSRILRYNPNGTYYSGHFSDYSTGGTYLGLYADSRSGAATDLAEYIYDAQGNLEAADVVVIDGYTNESVISSSLPYATNVAGVVSTKPHMVMGMELIRDEETGEEIPGVSAVRLSLAGRVPVKITDENGPIKRGDLLTSSSTLGHAMKWSLLDVNEAKDFEGLKTILAENERRRNAIIGKALEEHNSGTGKIMVLISLQ